MNIALIGSPGSGKSKLARALQKKLEPILGEKPAVIDGYVQKIQRQSELALGPFAEYSDNIMIAGVRRAAELSVRERSRITVGTVVDTLMYAAMITDILLHRTDTQMRSAYTQASAAMNGLALMMNSTWDYDLAFFTPRRVKDTSWESSLYDSELPAVIESFGIPVYEVKGTHADRVKFIPELIKATLEERETQTAE